LVDIHAQLVRERSNGGLGAWVEREEHFSLHHQVRIVHLGCR